MSQEQLNFPIQLPPEKKPTVTSPERLQRRYELDQGIEHAHQILGFLPDPEEIEPHLQARFTETGDLLNRMVSVLEELYTAYQTQEMLKAAPQPEIDQGEAEAKGRFNLALFQIVSRWLQRRHHTETTLPEEAEVPSEPEQLSVPEFPALIQDILCSLELIVLAYNSGDKANFSNSIALLHLRLQKYFQLGDYAVESD